jgi:hypothetical protein
MNWDKGKKTMKSLITFIIFTFLFVSLFAGIVSGESESDFGDMNESLNAYFIMRPMEENPDPDLQYSIGYNYPAPDLKYIIPRSYFIFYVTVTSVAYESVDDTYCIEITGPKIFESDTDTICVMRIDEVLRGELNESQLILHTNLLKSTFKEGDQLTVFLQKNPDNSFWLVQSPLSSLCRKDPPSEKYVGVLSPNYTFTEHELKTRIDYDNEKSLKNYFRYVLLLFTLQYKPVFFPQTL